MNLLTVIMAKLFKFSSFLATINNKLQKFRENVNGILHLNFNCNNLLNYCAFPFPFYWSQSLETYIVSKKILRIFVGVPVFKFIHVIFLTAIVIHGPFNASQKLPHSASAIFGINIASLTTSAIVDILAIKYSNEIVNCFQWAYQITKDFLLNLKFGKFQ